MDRDTRFRIWFAATREMHFTSTVEELLFEDGHYFEYGGVKEPVIYMMPLGRNDRSGNEIYEGDCIKLLKGKHRPKDYTGIVKYDDRQFEALFYDNLAFGAQDVLDYYGSVIQIIGNIHQNPEMLEV